MDLIRRHTHGPCWTKLIFFATGSWFLKKKKLLKIRLHTFAVSAAEGDGSRVSINDVQEEVSRVVVGLTGVSWEIEFKAKITYITSASSLVMLD